MNSNKFLMSFNLTRENILKICKEDSKCSFWAGKLADYIKDSKNPSEYEALIFVGKRVML